MTRLDILKKEQEQIRNMRCLCFDLKDKAEEYYQTEIDAIEIYGAPNKDYGEGSE